MEQQQDKTNRLFDELVTLKNTTMDGMYWSLAQWSLEEGIGRELEIQKYFNIQNLTHGVASEPVQVCGQMNCMVLQYNLQVQTACS